MLKESVRVASMARPRPASPKSSRVVGTEGDLNAKVLWFNVAVEIVIASPGIQIP